MISRDQILTKIEVMMFEAAKETFEVWRNQKLLPGEERQPPPVVLSTLLKNTHAAVLKSRQLGIGSELDQRDTDPHDLLMQIEEVRAQIKEEIRAKGLPPVN